MRINKFSWISLCLCFAIFIVTSGTVRAFDNLGHEETLDFCVTELGKRIGAENALKMEGHCSCATDLALDKTPETLKTPLARLVRHQGLRPEDRAALKAESGNLFLYIAMLDSHCPKILSDPMLQKLLLPTQ